MSTRAWIATLVAMMAGSVLFGTGAALVLSVPGLSRHAATLLPVAIALSLLAAPLIAWEVAPRLRARYWRGSGDRRS